MPHGVYEREPDCHLGSFNPHHFLDERQVRVIKRHLRDKTMSRKALAAKYRVSVSAIHEIARGAKWGHIEIED